MSDQGQPVLGVLVPCRNEAAVIDRKLANLARAAWPARGKRSHRLVVVDDGSDDGTGERAEAALARLFPGRAAPKPGAGPSVSVVPNDVRPGKAGALAAGLAALGDSVDVVVLTDADVVLEPGALTELARAFAEQPALGMACGSQRFVRDLAADGSCAGADGGEPVPAPGRYDRWTAAVRALESRAGRLFSVHGQLLAWRRELGLVPTPGIAADDLELMRQVRARGLRVEKLPGARFLEVKTPPGPGARAQALRRARAYIQVSSRCRLPAESPLVDRIQFAAYRLLPPAAPWLVLVGLIVVPALATVVGSPLVGALVGLSLLAVIMSPLGRHLARLLAVIAAARRVESQASLTDRWEMARDAGRGRP